MTDTTAQQILLAIIQQAQEGRSIVPQRIMSWREFRHYGRLLRGTKVVIKVLKTAGNNLFKSYCDHVTSGVSDVNRLIAHTELQDVVAFYERDIKILKEMLDEYDKYLGQGHFWYSFLGGERDLWD